MCALAEKILDGETIANGVDLGKPGYENMILNGNQLQGAGWITIDASNIDQYNF
jgi:simple sugar transport system substrate-binding protein